MELFGLSLSQHLDNIFNEVATRQSIYGFPLKSVYKPASDCDLSVSFHGKRAASPLGPASGPHTQMAQNIVLAFLGGCRIMELKTVQILDQLDIPRPCIDARTVGYNVEWSQEMSLAASYHEYVTAWVLLKIIEQEEILGYPKGHPYYQTIFDMSVGYDLKGISSEKVTSWIKNVKNASSYIQALLDQLPPTYARFKGMAIDEVVSNTLTLSTFHGCPRDEIQAIVEYLLGELGLDVYVKMNPTQLGYDTVHQLLTETMGYSHIQLDRNAFQEDLHFEEGVAMMKRLVAFASQRGRRTGAKFTNTMVVKNCDDFFSDDVMYLSGTPLHVLSMNAMLNFREAMGPEFPVSFSAGIDQNNFTDAVCCHMTPVTTCTDLLKKGGYTRAVKYLKALERSMKKEQVTCLDDLIRKRAGNDSQDVAVAGLAYAKRLVPSLASLEKYQHARNRTPPKKVDSHLSTFDCLTCNICLPICPNAANFSLPIGKREIPYPRLRLTEAGFETSGQETLVLEKAAQIANLADFCNECADCEVFCPELGGPQIAKPRFFSSLSSFEGANSKSGFYFDNRNTLKSRFDNKLYKLTHLNTDWLFEHADGNTFVFDHQNQLIKATASETMETGQEANLEHFVVMKTFFEALTNSKDYPAVLLHS